MVKSKNCSNSNGQLPVLAMAGVAVILVLISASCTSGITGPPRRAPDRTSYSQVEQHILPQIIFTNLPAGVDLECYQAHKFGLDCGLEIPIGVDPTGLQWRLPQTSQIVGLRHPAEEPAASWVLTLGEAAKQDDFEMFLTGSGQTTGLRIELAGQNFGLKGRAQPDKAARPHLVLVPTVFGGRLASPLIFTRPGIRLEEVPPDARISVDPFHDRSGLQFKLAVPPGQNLDSFGWSYFSFGDGSRRFAGPAQISLANQTVLIEDSSRSFAAEFDLDWSVRCLDWQSDLPLQTVTAQSELFMNRYGRLGFRAPATQCGSHGLIAEVTLRPRA